MRRAGRGRAGEAAGARHLALTATDGEWETVRRNARRRGLPIARYLVGLALRDGGAPDAGPELALPPAAQRELLEGVREVRALMLEGGETASLVRDMRERIAVQFDAWAASLAGAGRERELRAALAAVLGAARARPVADRIVAGARAGAAEAGDPRGERAVRPS